MHNLVVACLEESRAAFQTQLEALATADPPVVQHAVDATVALPRLSACEDELELARRLPLPDDPETRDAIGEVRRELRAANTLRTLGDFDAAHARTAGLLERAEAIGWRPLEAEALYTVSRVLSRRGDGDGALEAAERGFFIAGATGHDELALQLAARLTSLHADGRTDPERGLEWSNVAMMLFERMGNEPEILLADALNTRGAALEVKGDYEGAMEADRRALEIRERLMGPDHALTCGSLQNLGMVHYALGQYDKALELHHEVLTRRRGVLGDLHPDMAETYNHIGITHEVTGNYPEAFTYLRKALSIAEQTLGPEHPFLADLHNNLGNVYADIGEHEQSLTELKLALDISTRTRGEKSLDVARSLNNLANAYAGLGRNEEALETQRRALAILDEQLGPEHGLAGMVHDNMGVMLRELGRHDEAAVEWERGLAIREKAFGPTHPDVALSLVHLAGARLAAGDYDAAAEAYERGLDIRGRQKTAAAVLADLQFGLARALLGANRELDRAVELATSARDNYASEGETYAELRDETDAWLREHHVARPGQ
jgi:serine/threonine-protein kinase